MRRRTLRPGSDSAQSTVVLLIHSSSLRHACSTSRYATRHHVATTVACELSKVRLSKRVPSRREAVTSLQCVTAIELFWHSTFAKVLAAHSILFRELSPPDSQSGHSSHTDAFASRSPQYAPASNSLCASRAIKGNGLTEEVSPKRQSLVPNIN